MHVSRKRVKYNDGLCCSAKEYEIVVLADFDTDEAPLLEGPDPIKKKKIGLWLP